MSKLRGIGRRRVYENLASLARDRETYSGTDVQWEKKLLRILSVAAIAGSSVSLISHIGDSGHRHARHAAIERTTVSHTGAHVNPAKLSEAQSMPTTTLTIPATTTTTVQPAAKVPVCAVLYLWYGYNYKTGTWTGGKGTSHWNDVPWAVVKDTPADGYYSSPAMIPKQLEEMKNAGINCAIISWWGSGSGAPFVNDPLYAAINNITKEVFESAKSLGSSFKLAIMVDAFTQYPLPDSQYPQIYSYINSNFYAPYSSEVLQWLGKPLLLWFNRPLNPPSDRRFTSRVLNLNPGWPFWKAPLGDFNSWGGAITNPCPIYCDQIISPDGYASILPRYDDYYLNQAGGRTSYMRVDFDYSKDLYSLEWNYLISHAKSVKLVVIYSWNEYHERSAIEPHADFTDPAASQTYLLDITKKEIAALERAAE